MVVGITYVAQGAGLFTLRSNVSYTEVTWCVDSGGVLVSTSWSVAASAYDSPPLKPTFLEMVAASLLQWKRVFIPLPLAFPFLLTEMTAHAPSALSLQRGQTSCEFFLFPFLHLQFGELSPQMQVNLWLVLWAVLLRISLVTEKWFYCFTDEAELIRFWEQTLSTNT